MRVAAITAEYNPFHNGHAFQISRTRNAGATHIVAVMSGNYVQRGEPALLEKHLRARAALLCGADLILELPLPRAVATAERFAAGSVALMQALGCVDMMSFGAEDSLEALMPVARLLAEDGLGAQLRQFQQTGRTFAAARALALSAIMGPEAALLLEKPNNILAVEYLKAAIRLDFSPEFLAIPRRGAAHDASVPAGRFASASALRTLAHGPSGFDNMAPFVPAAAHAVYREAAACGHAPASPAVLDAAMPHVLRRLAPKDLAALPDVSEGLENRLYSAIRTSATAAALYDTAKTKRYTHARIRRLALCAYLGITELDALAPPPYLRILGFNKRGAELLRFLGHRARLPLSTSLAKLARQDAACSRMAELEARSTDLFVLGLPSPLPCGLDYTAPPVLLK